MLNYFNFKRIGNEILITNDFGCYAFLTQQDFQKFLSGEISSSDENYRYLYDNYFLYDEPREVFITKAVGALRSIKSYLFTSTALHIFAVSNICNMNCCYCQAIKSYSKNKENMMTFETGLKAIELAMQSPTKHLTFEFQGGEPLLNIDVVKAMVAHSKSINTNKIIQYTIVTNLINLSDDDLNYLIRENISICTSLDGNAVVHDHNRKLKDNKGSFNAVCEGIAKVRNAGQEIGAIQTTSRHSLAYPKEIVDEYIKLGINGIFLRPLTPLGSARLHWNEIGYSPEEYLSFYEKALDYIIQININGMYYPEFHSVYFLRKILSGNTDNYMELRSPCGASIGQLSYYFNGDIYTCDEGRMLSEMGDRSFKLGNVYENNYNDLIQSKTCKATCVASIIESLPHCCDCVYQPYCGVCPVVAYADDFDIFPKSPRDFRCKIHEGMLNILFERIRKNDDDIMKVFFSWIGEFDEC